MVKEVEAAGIEYWGNAHLTMLSTLFIFVQYVTISLDVEGNIRLDHTILPH
ncbi:MAG: hypothetical protein ACXADC_16555 [Candidatus Thorarchaeota archaeon]|jgi:hypothetical protein